MIADSDSCINIVVSKLITTLGDENCGASKPLQGHVDRRYINDVQEGRRILIQFVTYTDNIWCDILSMDVGHIILGRS